tara:strand:+ start:786 stop:1967 length:1182 start_codon:yes stop_codon:yes gene_type:complete
MLFGEKISLTSRIVKKYSSIDLTILGSIIEEHNYRNKSVYTFNLEDNYLDQQTFEIIGLDHSKIIQYINIKINREKSKDFKVIDIYIKNNYSNQYQLCFCIKSKCTCSDIYMKSITKYIFNLIKNINNDLDVNIVSCYYHIYVKGLGLKEKQFNLIYGNPKLCEFIPLELTGLIESKPIKGIDINISPYSFSRINYNNSIIVYQKIYDLCYNNISSSKTNNYMIFGRDIYCPAKILTLLKVKWFALTHCPITFKDFSDDEMLAPLINNCSLVKKKDYAKNIINLFTSYNDNCEEEGSGEGSGKGSGEGSGEGVDIKWNLILTSSRNGLGSTMCNMLVKFKHKINQIIYISCNRENMEKDFEILLTDRIYNLTQAYISNEFSLTNYNNTICVLT